MARTRPAAVAGTFYPADPRALRDAVDTYLAAVEVDLAESAPKALIAPHAGYVYSGAVAASAHARLCALRGRVERVVLLGPSHRVWVEGLAAWDGDAFSTPLGQVPIDRAGVTEALTLPQVSLLDAAHREEHSLEVHLPFLQRALGEFSLVPLVVGGATPEQVAEVLEVLWGGPETRIVVSSDLSHYHDYETARLRDARTTRAIESLDVAGLDEESACGRVPICGLLAVAERRGLRVRTLDLRSSGDTAGPRDRVVGYGAYALA